ncbi:MAG: BBP7 family outer membrane beta-barrel protein, partial [Planctomycetota bacterium]
MNDQKSVGQNFESNAAQLEQRPLTSYSPEAPAVRPQWVESSSEDSRESAFDSAHEAHRESEIRRVAHWGAADPIATPPIPGTNVISPRVPTTSLADFGLPPLPAPKPGTLGVTTGLQQSSASFATRTSFGLPPLDLNPAPVRLTPPSMSEALNVAPLPGMEKATGLRNQVAPPTIAGAQNIQPLPDLSNVQLMESPQNVGSLQQLAIPVAPIQVDEYGLPFKPCYSLRWIKAEFLGWFVGDDSLPPLLTTAPASAPSHSAGQLGQPTTDILFGDMGRFTPGARWTMGYIPNTCCACWQPEFEFFGLNSRGSQTFDNSDGTLVRPFYNTDPTVNGPDTQILNMAGISNGTMAFNFGSQLLSAAPRLRKPLWNCAT